MAVIVEVFNHALQVVERHRFTGNRVSIGRSYANHVITSDIYTDPFHLDIELLENGDFVIHDKKTLNGTKVNGRRIDLNQAAKNGVQVQIGRTKLRVIDPNHEVADAEHLSLLDRAVARLAHGLPLIILLMLFFGKDSWVLLTQTDSGKLLQSYVEQIQLQTAIVIGHTLFWSLWGRLSKHETRHTYHAAAIMLLLIGYWGYQFIALVLAYNIDQPQVIQLIDSVAISLLSASAVWLGLHFSSRISATKKKGAALLIAISTFGYSHYRHYQTDEFTPLPGNNPLLLPPSLQFSAPVSVEDFVARAEQLMTDQHTTPRKH